MNRKHSFCRDALFLQLSGNGKKCGCCWRRPRHHQRNRPHDGCRKGHRWNDEGVDLQIVSFAASIEWCFNVIRDTSYVSTIHFYFVDCRQIYYWWSCWHRQRDERWNDELGLWDKRSLRVRYSSFCFLTSVSNAQFTHTSHSQKLWSFKFVISFFFLGHLMSHVLFRSAFKSDEGDSQVPAKPRKRGSIFNVDLPDSHRHQIRFLTPCAAVRKERRRWMMLNAS